MPFTVYTLEIMRLCIFRASNGVAGKLQTVALKLPGRSRVVVVSTACYGHD